jgi:hypothetical protein
MNYWAIEAAEDSPFSLMQDQALSDAVHRHGLSPTAARQAIHAAGCEPVLKLFEHGTEALAPPQAAVPDCTYSSWIPVFSTAARALCLAYGSVAEDFLSCSFTAHPDRKFFLHLPIDAPEVVDVSQTEFLMTIPANPPIPFHITKLVFAGEPRAGCFRATIPGHQQVFAELIVSQAFKDAWVREGLTGAEFRSLETSSTEQLQASDQLHQ